MTTEDSRPSNSTGSRADPERIDGDLDDVLASITDISEHDHDSAFGGTVTALLARLRHGDRDAEDGLYRAVIDQLVGKARKVLGAYGVGRQIIEPEELISEVFGNLRRVLASYDVRNRQHFFCIACNNFRWKIGEILTRVRRRVGEVSDENIPEPPSEETTVCSLLARAELIESLLREINELDEEQQQIVECRLFLDMSFREIGELLECPHTTVSYRYQGIIKRLRERLTAQG